MNDVLWPVDNSGHIRHAYILNTFMQSGNNIHVQQHMPNMINEEWNKTQNDAPFVAVYGMRAVTFVLPDEMSDVSIAALQWFILLPRLNHTGSHRPIDSHSKAYLHQEKNIGFGTRTTKSAAILRITWKAAVRLYLVASYDMP